MQIEQLQHEFERVQADLADGPILPSVTVDEIRSYLASQYQFQKELPLDEVVQDAERMLRTWQVQVTHPRYLGLFNPAVTLPSVIAETLVAMYNSQLANWRTSPVGNEIERLYSADVGAHSHAKPSESGSRCNGPNKKWQLPGR